MTLPKISHPIYYITVPSSGRKYPFRPFTVKEEKILLIAKTSEDKKDIMVAIKQIANNCCVDDKFDVDSLTLTDLSYVFIMIRSQSVSNTVTVTYKDFEDGKEYDFEVDLSRVMIRQYDGFEPSGEKIIKITDKTGLVVGYPTVALYEDEDFLSSGEEAFFKMMCRCVKKIYDEDTVYVASSYSDEEIEEFMEGLSVRSYEEIREFIKTMPTVEYVIEYKNSLGSDRRIVLSALSDFFTF